MKCRYFTVFIFGILTASCNLEGNINIPSTLVMKKQLTQLSNWFGTSVDIDGDKLVVGAWGDNESSATAGAAFVYKKAATWELEQKLLASDGPSHPDARLGSSVAIDGGWAVISGWNYSTYVFRYNGTAWVEFQNLGYSGVFDLIKTVGIDENWIVLLTASSFPVFFKFNGTDWEQVQIGTYGGRSVDIDGNRAIIGGNGSAYIYKYNGMEWELEQEILGSDSLPDDGFGYSVGISGNKVVVGAFKAWSKASAYFFELNGNWIEKKKITDYPETGFGCSVSISGLWSVIGSYNYIALPVVGLAKFYFYTGNNWELHQELYKDNSDNMRFGWSVATNGNSIIVGTGSAGYSVFIFEE